MHSVTLVTGSQYKLQEWQRQVPTTISLSNKAVDLDEIQSLDSVEIVRHKLAQAYELLKTPVIVEDVSAGLDKLNGLPGPFIKFFNERLGQDSLYKLGGDGATATATCTIGYYDGSQEIIATGTMHGTIVAPQSEGYGFEIVFVPAGQTKTMAHMTPAEKDALSHRHLAITDLVAQLEYL